MVLSGVPQKKAPVTPPGINPGTVRLVAQCLNYYATPGPIEQYVHNNNNMLKLRSESQKTYRFNIIKTSPLILFR